MGARHDFHFVHKKLFGSIGAVRVLGKTEVMTTELVVSKRTQKNFMKEAIYTDKKQSRHVHIKNICKYIQIGIKLPSRASMSQSLANGALGVPPKSQSSST